MSREKPPFLCPVCGYAVPPGASACPQCGSDAETGWSQDAYLDGIDLPGDFDYDEAARREFAPAKKPFSFRPTWQVAAGAVLLILIILGLLRMMAG